MMCNLSTDDYVLQHACPTLDPSQESGLDKVRNASIFSPQWGSRFHSSLLLQSPAPLLPNFGAGSYRGYAQDVNMMSLFNGKERTISDMKLLG